MTHATDDRGSMDAEPVSVFVLTVQAVAGPRNSEPDGRRYDILAFARGDDEAAAEAVARAGLADRGWDEAVVLRSGEIVDAGAVPEDLRGPFARALKDGCALVIYDAA
jgi:hypothetical protein